MHVGYATTRNTHRLDIRPGHFTFQVRVSPKQEILECHSGLLVQLDRRLSFEVALRGWLWFSPRLCPLFLRNGRKGVAESSRSRRD